MPSVRSANKNEEIARLWNLGVAIPEIGKHVGMSAKAVTEHASRLELGPHGGRRIAPRALIEGAVKTISGKTAPPEKSAWTPIAVQRYGEWQELPDTPWPIDIVQPMVRDGNLLTALRREDGRMVLVGKKPKK